MELFMGVVGHNLGGQSLVILKPYNHHNYDLRRSRIINKHCLISSSNLKEEGESKSSSAVRKKRCLRCNTLYSDEDNSPTACSFHGHTTGERGLYALAPPHQGIDGEWSEGSGVIVYRWNDKHNRPNTGMPNWKKRWSCCAEYAEDSPPCRRGCHVSYDDGHTLY